MGEWSEYFEDFPEENPANQVGDRYDPEAAATLRKQKENDDRLRQECRELQKKLDDLANSIKRAADERSRFPTKD